MMKRTPAHRPIIATFWRSGPTSVMWGNLRARFEWHILLGMNVCRRLSRASGWEHEREL
jgi:hypothetical protein